MTYLLLLPHVLTSVGIDEHLFRRLQLFEQQQNNLREVCAYAYELRRTEAVQTLTTRHNKSEGRNRWSDIRHNIGRLGCWHKAVKILVEAARTFPQQLEGAVVNLVIPWGLPNLPPARNSGTDTKFEMLVSRMISNDQHNIAPMLVQSLNELDMVLPLKQQFQKVYSTFQPRAHAELLVLETFFQLNLDFVHNDKYVGCSKPSCYCCNLYMKVHPGKFEQRPCHGNLWPNWAPPIPLSAIGLSQNPSEPPQKLQEHHTFRMLQNMVTHVRTDVRNQILSRRPRRERLPDSSTGMSSVIIDFSQSQVLTLGEDQIDSESATRSMLVVANSEQRLGAAQVAYNIPAQRNIELILKREDNPISTVGNMKASTIIEETEKASETSSSVIAEDSTSDDEDCGVLLFSGRQNQQAL